MGSKHQLNNFQTSSWQTQETYFILHRRNSWKQSLDDSTQHSAKQASYLRTLFLVSQAKGWHGTAYELFKRWAFIVIIQNGVAWSYKQPQCAIRPRHCTHHGVGWRGGIGEGGLYQSRFYHALAFLNRRPHLKDFTNDTYGCRSAFFWLLLLLFLVGVAGVSPVVKKTVSGWEEQPCLNSCVLILTTCSRTDSWYICLLARTEIW